MSMISRLENNVFGFACLLVLVRIYLVHPTAAAVTAITANTKSASGRLGRDAAAIAEEISSSSNPQSAKAKNTSTIPSAEAGINSQTDVQASATETGTTP
jgi:hypothetical protein